MVGRPNLPAETCFDSSRGQNIAWQCISSKCMHQPTPYHVHDSKEFGTWPSDHQSCISMRDGPRSQVVHFDFKCNAHKQTHKAQSLSLGQETRHACKMQCNLGMELSIQCEHEGKHANMNMDNTETCNNMMKWSKHATIYKTCEQQHVKMVLH